MLYERHSVLAEPVAGVIEAEECPTHAALREAQEELGLQLRNIEVVGRVWVTPSSTSEKAFLFLGEYEPADRTGSGGGAAGEQENLVIREEPLRELWAAAQGPELMDAKLFMLLQALHIRRPELFEREDDRW